MLHKEKAEKMNFATFPHCVIDNIFAHCRFRAQLNLSQTCRKLYNYFEPDEIWETALVDTFGRNWEGLWEIYAEIKELR